MSLRNCLSPIAVIELERRAALVFTPDALPRVPVLFEDLVVVFKVMISMNMLKRGWYQRTRVWNLALLQVRLPKPKRVWGSLSAPASTSIKMLLTITITLHATVQDMDGSWRRSDDFALALFARDEKSPNAHSAKLFDNAAIARSLPEVLRDTGLPVMIQERTWSTLLGIAATDLMQVRVRFSPSLFFFLSPPAAGRVQTS